MAAKHKLLGSLRQYFSDYLSAMGARGPFGQLVVKAAHHPELRKRLIDAPNSTLAAEGVKLPPGFTVDVFENTADTIHIVLPPLLDSDEEKGN